jgi:deoxycytidylate deaminase
MRTARIGETLCCKKVTRGSTVSARSPSHFDKETQPGDDRKKGGIGAKAMSAQPANDLLQSVERKVAAKEISERLFEEIVIALVGPVGSGVTTAANFIKEILQNEFQYDVAPIIVPSKIIRDEAHRVGMSSIPEQPRHEYITEMQTAGNKLREKFGGDYLAEKAVEQIYKFRKKKNGVTDDGIAIPGRRAYVIDSLKNIDELKLLKDIYRETVCVFGVFAPDAIRKTRLEDDGVPKDSTTKIMNRDKGEVATFGQMTRKLFVQSDFFVCNDTKKDELRNKLGRFLSIFFNAAVHTPTRAESAMYEASAAAANSSCLSRQVGASIVSSDGEIISVGWNDVPRFGGGLYIEDDQYIFDGNKNAIVDVDRRCFKWKDKICHNESKRKNIADEIVGKLISLGYIKKATSKQDAIDAIRETRVDTLVEFSRSIHAEMEAILSVARSGRHSLKGSALYVTTYPCHNCARHIVASGIKSVIYIEPYDKSLATDLHSDSVTEEPDDTGRVVFRQYDGVAPRHYLTLFQPAGSRKENGRLVEKKPSLCKPVFRIPLDAQIDYELKVIADLSSKENTESELD